jgi:cytochrome b561
VADLLVRGVDEEIVRALKARAGAHGRSAASRVIGSSQSANLILALAALLSAAALVRALLPKDGVLRRML